jgi:hypothetical protein
VGTADPGLGPQLAALAEELRGAVRRARRLAAGVEEDTWRARPGAGSWSAAECLEHLAITARDFLPHLDAALAPWEETARRPGRRHRSDPVGWLLARLLEPPARWRSRTTSPFEPLETRGRQEALDAFDALQEELVVRLERAEGLPLGRIRIRSPFDPRVRYNLYACFRILAAHQRRHLWQAQRAVAAVAAAGRGRP